ncbi:MAG TPA: EI24 domain-containing protein [Planctomycetota bacterium]|nr:EI24 domain-containing protein [Planctomycetota bacterium]
MTQHPCPRCGYHAPSLPCPHCAHPRPEGQEGAVGDPSLRGAPTGPALGAVDGLRAVPTGLFILMTTSGVKRWLIPPLLATTVLFTLLFSWLWALLQDLVAAVDITDPESIGLDEGWLREAVVWILEGGFVTWAAQASSWLLLVALAFIAVLWTFSIIYEALSGPFLDEIQGRLESRWFGADPRSSLERPTDIPTRRCAILSVLAALPATACLTLWWTGAGLVAWLWLAGIPLSFLLASLLDGRYRSWLAWIIRVEGKTLFVSIKAAGLAGLLLVVFIWVKFIPGVGPALFVILAGFTTALSLLDIPFSRRGWPLAMRLAFLRRNFLPAVAYGIVSGLFFLLPIVGPILMVPSASIGGLWLLCRLDKNNLRPPGAREA